MQLAAQIEVTKKNVSGKFNIRTHTRCGNVFIKQTDYLNDEGYNHFSKTIKDPNYSTHITERSNGSKCSAVGSDSDSDLE